MTRLKIFIAAALFSVAGSVAHAETTAPACPVNQVVIIRESQLTSPAALDGFKKAFADHAKWYADHGYSADRFTWGKVLVRDPVSNNVVASPDKIYTFHWSDSDVPMSAQDAGWKAFVAEYSQVSRILSTTWGCMAN